MTKSVAILGCGPAGLMVAHAAELSGWDFHIYSRKQKSALYGAQYLHQPIPSMNGGPQTVQYTMQGTAEQYRHKVYGDTWDGTVSPEDFPEPHSAWDLRQAYDGLWDKYCNEIEHVEFLELKGVVFLHDLVISTVPRKIWAQPGDVFESTKVWALGDTEMPRVEPAYRPAPFTVMCDARPHIPWYRVSNIYGYCTIEWPYNVREHDWPDGLHGGTMKVMMSPHPGASLVEKPLCHNSTAASDFIHLGRYGAWEKGVLTSDVFYQAMKIFAKDTIDG